MAITAMIMEETLVIRMMMVARHLARILAPRMIAAVLAIHRIYVTGVEDQVVLVMQREAFMAV